MLPRIDALGNPAVHKVQKWVKPFLHDLIGHDPYHMGMPADSSRESALVPPGQQVAPPRDAVNQAVKPWLNDPGRAFDLSAGPHVLDLRPFDAARFAREHPIELMQVPSMECKGTY